MLKKAIIIGQNKLNNYHFIFIYRTRAIIGRSRFEAAIVYKPRILVLKSEEFPFLVHKLSVIQAAASVKNG